MDLLIKINLSTDKVPVWYPTNRYTFFSKSNFLLLLRKRKKNLLSIYYSVTDADLMSGTKELTSAWWNTMFIDILLRLENQT